MSFTRDCVTQDIQFECDGCGDQLQTTTRHLKAANAEAKEQGWRTYKDDSEWVHKCSFCKDVFQ